MSSHLLILLNNLLLGFSNDSLQLMKAMLHFSKAHASSLLLLTNSLQLLSALLLSDARTLLPLLNTLWKNLVDPAAKPASKQSTSFCTYVEATFRDEQGVFKDLIINT